MVHETNSLPIKQDNYFWNDILSQGYSGCVRCEICISIVYLNMLWFHQVSSSNCFTINYISQGFTIITNRFSIILSSAPNENILVSLGNGGQQEGSSTIAGHRHGGRADTAWSEPLDTHLDGQLLPRDLKYTVYSIQAFSLDNFGIFSEYKSVATTSI